MAILIVVVAASVGLWLISRSHTFQVFGEIIPRVNTSRRVVALTFDDGPLPNPTNEVLSILRSKGIKATFFVTGKEMEEHPLSARALVREGEELGNHSYSHQRMIFKSQAFIRNEIETTDRIIQRAGYKGEIFFRPPYGRKLLGLPFYLRQTGRKTIMWDVEADSYRDIAADPDKIVRYIRTHVRPGSIILLHVMYKSGAPSLKAVPAIIDALKSQGYRFETVSEMLHTPPDDKKGRAAGA